MFENLLKELKQLDGMKVSVSIEADEDGYMDRECPADNCKSRYSVIGMGKYKIKCTKPTLIFIGEKIEKKPF